VVVLDRDLPAVHGDRVCRRLVRDGSPSRILMLTAATDVEDRVDGLEPGSSATQRASRPLNDRISPVACAVTWSKSASSCQLDDPGLSVSAPNSTGKRAAARARTDTVADNPYAPPDVGYVRSSGRREARSASGHRTLEMPGTRAAE